MVLGEEQTSLMGRRVWIATGALLAACLSMSAASDPLILVDHSGSMTGFDTTGALPRVISQIERAAGEEAVVLRAIASRGGGLELFSGAPPARYGAETRIYDSVRASLSRHPEASTLWLLTDNVPSHAQADRDLHAFYDWLRSDSGPVAVTLFVLKLPFRGVIYGSDDSRLTSDYSANRALVLYAALLDRDRREDYQRALDRMAEAVDAHGSGSGEALRLRCKPLRDSVELQLEPGTMQVDDGVLLGRGNEGQPFRGTFEIKLRSRNEGVRFRNAVPRFEVGDAFQTTDFDTKEAEATIEQRTIDEIGSDWQSIHGELILEPVRLRRTFGSALRAFAKGERPGVVAGSLLLRLDVERESVVIDPEDVRAFSTERLDDASVAVQSRVYRLQDLFQGKFVEERLELWPTARGDEILFTADEQPGGQVPVRVDMAYSPISALILFLGVGLPILLVVAILVYLLRGWNAQYVLIADGASERPFRVRTSHGVRLAGDRLGVLYQVPPLLWFRPAGGWNLASKSMLSRSGDSVEVKRRSDGRRVKFRLERLRAQLRGRRRDAMDKRAASRNPFGSRRVG